jgi:hypothetical protein
VRHTRLVARLALRELWISYQLLLVLSAYVGVGAAVALLPEALPTTLERLAIGVGAATVVAAAAAAGSIARERVLGRAGWLVTRSIGRGTVLVGWFVALASVVLVGLAAAGVLGWLAASSVEARVDKRAFAAAFIGVGAVALVAIALGLLLGSVLRPRTAVLATVVACLGIGLAVWLGLPWLTTPIAALVELPRMSRPIATALQGAGACLAAAAAILAIARVAFGRVDL